jgi:hypothetical protein
MNVTNITKFLNYSLDDIGDTLPQIASVLENEALPPADEWCFDLIMYFRSISEENDDLQAQRILPRLET